MTQWVATWGGGLRSAKNRPEVKTARELGWIVRDAKEEKD